MNPDPAKYKTWTWKNAVMLHWIMNPGLAVNELVFGQRIARRILIEKDKSRPLVVRSFIPCPHCNTLHSGMKWSSRNKTAFGNWFGLYCDHCGKIIPCLRNLTSLVLLGVTFPLWIWFIKGWKKKWLAVQAEKFSRPMNLDLPGYNWVSGGLSWGFFMFIIMDVLPPLYHQEGYKPLKLALAVAIWSLSGLLFGFVMKKILFKPGTGCRRTKCRKLPDKTFRQNS